MSFNLDKLLEILRPYLDDVPKSGRVWIAYSGGLDSTVLLNAIAQLQAVPPWSKFEICAIHVNHGLSAQADHWQTHCQDQCRALGIPLVCQTVEVKSKGQGIEAAARQQRYAVFSSLMGKGDLLLLAQHQDDQAETLFLRLLRGAGIKGLGAMDEARACGVGRLVRPLLKVSRQQLQDYARGQNLCWIEDDSNSDEQFDRNFLRQSVLPLLEKRWPSLNQRWARTAQVLRENEQALNELADLDLVACDEQLARLGRRLRWPSLAQLSKARRHNLLRSWCQRQALVKPELKHLEQMDKALDDGSPVAVQWKSAEFRSYKGFIYLLPKIADIDGMLGLGLDNKTELPLPDRSLLEINVAPGGLAAKPEELEIRWRQGGERCQPQDRNRSQTLKKCLQEYELEPWLRTHVPLIYHKNSLVAVADLWVCRGYQAPPDQLGLCFHWFYPNIPAAN